MTILTEKQMRNAIFARAVDRDVDFETPQDFINELVYNECGYPLADWQEYSYSSKEEMAQKIRKARHDHMQRYNDGEAILKSYTMTTTSATTALAGAQYDQDTESAKPNVAGTYLRECGYGQGTSMRYDVVVFKVKK